jgi:nitrate/nitrite transport system permease protein
MFGLAVVASAWWFASTRVAELPSPAVTAKTFGRLMKDPFHNGGPNDKGIGLQFVGSLQRVFFGFGIAALVGIPFGLFIGSNKRAWKAANPVIQLLRPVSPLAWFPIWLYVLKDSPQAAKFVILITALWPILINTAAAAGSIPPDQRNVAKVFKFNTRTYVRHVLLPNAMPGIVTGMRLSMGVAWMVIVAVEMMSVGTGVGFFVWEAYNAGDLSVVMAAIIMIGLVGLTLDMFFLKLGKRFALPGTSGAHS